MREPVLRVMLAVYRRLPRRARITAVHLSTPSHTLGGLVVIEDGDRILLVKPTYKRGWSLPGGLAKRGEHPEQTARREAREEVGVEVELTSPAALVVEPSIRRIDAIYAGRIVGGAVPTASSVEIGDVRWFARDALPLLSTEAAGGLLALDRLRAR